MFFIVGEVCVSKDIERIEPEHDEVDLHIGGERIQGVEVGRHLLDQLLVASGGLSQPRVSPLLLQAQLPGSSQP